MHLPEEDWRAVAYQIGRLTGNYIEASGETGKLDDIAVAVGLDQATIDRTLQAAVDPPLAAAARLARYAGAALTVVPKDHLHPDPRPRPPSDLAAAAKDVDDIQAVLKRLRQATGLALPAFALSHELPLAAVAAAETDPAAATLGGVAAMAFRFGLVLRAVPPAHLAAILATSFDVGRAGACCGLADPGDAPADVEWIRRTMEEAMAMSRVDAATLARRVHLPEAVSASPDACKVIGPFRTTASLAAGLGLVLSVVERADRDAALIRLGTRLSEARPLPGFSPAGAMSAVRRQEKAVLAAVKGRRSAGGHDHAQIAAACGASERAVRDAERGLMPLPLHRIARHAEVLGLALVLQAA